jgi:type VI secretion system protein ImpH
MLSAKCKIEDYNISELTFGELVKFIELFRYSSSSRRLIQFKTYLDASVAHNGIVQIKQNWSPAGTILPSYAYTIFSNIITLLGPTGILPSHYTERAIAFLREGDKTMIDFLDIFYNKLMYSLYRILRYSDVLLSFQLYALGKEARLPYVVRQVGSFVGVQYEQGMKDMSMMLRYSGVLAMHSRSACVLQGILSSFIECFVSIDQFILIKTPLPKCEQTRLGRNSHLTFYCASNVYLSQSKILITIRNLSIARYRQLVQQKRDQNSPLNRLLSVYLGSRTTYEIILIPKEPEKLTQLLARDTPKLGIDLWCSLGRLV